MKKIFIYIIAGTLLLAGCKKLDQLPQATASKDAVFGSEKGLHRRNQSYYSPVSEFSAA